jgi:hypothetical protein
VNNLERESLTMIADTIRVELLARCAHIRTKLWSLELSYRGANHPPGIKVDSLIDRSTSREHSTLLFSMLRASVKLARYLLGEAPFLLDPSLTYTISHGRDRIKDYQVMQETLLFLFIGLDSDSFQRRGETALVFEDVAPSSYLALVSNVILVLRRLSNILLGRSDALEIDMRNILHQIESAYSNYGPIRDSSQKLASSSMNPLEGNLPRHKQELQMLKSKYSGSSLANIERRVHDLSTSPLNMGPNSITALAVKILSILDSLPSAISSPVYIVSSQENEKENTAGN